VTGGSTLMRGCLMIALGLTTTRCASSGRHDSDAGPAAAPPASAPDARRTAARTGDLDVRPEQLLGLNAGRLTALLGPADFTRSDGPAEIRQFRGSDCMVDVFLYQQTAADDYRVAHVEARDNREVVGTAESPCAVALLRARRLRATAG
jgi:hypothetical protein